MMGLGSDCCHSDHGHHHGPGGHHDHHFELDPNNHQFKKILWIALILNAAMFFVEVFFGVMSHSVSLRADAIDFFGDSVNYGATLFVLSSHRKTKAMVSLLKSLFMAIFGAWVFGEALMRFFTGDMPIPFTMGWVGALALLVNLFVALLLYKFRDGDSNMQSVWLCSRNDAIGNLAIVLASLGVYYLGHKWPDLIIALFMAFLAVSSAIKITKKAYTEWIDKGSH